MTMAAAVRGKREYYPDKGCTHETCYTTKAFSPGLHKYKRKYVA